MATGFDGQSPAGALPVIGSYCPIIPFKETPANATSMTITFPQLRRIRGWLVQALNSSNEILGGDSDGALGMVVTASGNVLTIADGTDFDLSAHTSGEIYGLV